jgi:hypothetical protein
MAQQIVIAAQAQPEGVGEEALSFSHLTKGLINRLSPIIISSTSEANNNLEDEALSSEQRFIESRNFIEAIYNAVGSGVASEAESTENFEEKNTEPNADAKGPITKGVNEKNIKKLISDALTAVFGNLRKIANDQNPKLPKTSESLLALEAAKTKILANFDWKQFRTQVNELNPVRDEKREVSDQIVEFDLKTADLYDYVIREISKNDNYEGVETFDTDLEDLWEKELDRLGNISTSDL